MVPADIFVTENAFFIFKGFILLFLTRYLKSVVGSNQLLQCSKTR